MPHWRKHILLNYNKLHWITSQNTFIIYLPQTKSADTALHFLTRFAHHKSTLSLHYTWSKSLHTDKGSEYHGRIGELPRTSTAGQPECPNTTLAFRVCPGLARRAPHPRSISQSFWFSCAFSFSLFTVLMLFLHFPAAWHFSSTFFWISICLSVQFAISVSHLSCIYLIP